MERKGRWIEVLKKMMHHHTFTLFPVSGGCGRASVCMCVISKFLHAFKCVCRCVHAKMLTERSSSRVGGGGSSLLVPAISRRANFHLKEHSAHLFPLLSTSVLLHLPPPVSAILLISPGRLFYSTMTQKHSF